jgi:hypothetical protein
MAATASGRQARVPARCILEPMVPAVAAGHDQSMQMRIANERFLCDYEDADDWYQLWAVLDELTLTYSVLVRTPDGASRALRRHVASLRDARAWAGGYRDRQLEAPGRPSDGAHGPALRPTTLETRCRA